MDNLEGLTHRSNVENFELNNPEELEDELLQQGLKAADAEDTMAVAGNVSQFYQSASTFAEEITGYLCEFTGKLEEARWMRDQENDIESATAALDEASEVLDNVQEQYDRMIAPLADNGLVATVESSYGHVLDEAQAGYESSWDHVMRDQDVSYTSAPAEKGTLT